MSSITINSKTNLANTVANKFQEWVSYRQRREQDWEDTTRYIYATSTRDTQNASLPWKNSTTRPKLAQIRENLHSNYMASEFSSDRWLSFVASPMVSNAKEKAQIAEKFTTNKLESIGFDQFISQIVYDWIDYGNAFARLEYIRDVTFDKESGEVVTKYVGAKPVRISPYDIVFDPTATSFEESPKIIRTLMPIGTLIEKINKEPSFKVYEPFLKDIKGARARTSTSGDKHKDASYRIAGFNTYQSYLDSDLVEILEFFGSYYDKSTQEVYSDRHVIVVDGNILISDESSQSWYGGQYIYQASWKKRPDSLWAMSPLDNLLGLQYRIDHLENLKSDVFDMLSQPVVVIKGDVAFEGWKPGATAYLNDEASFNIVHPDVSILQTNIDIRELESTMEEMAGAPKTAMGFRTPGEKTAFEVQSLDNSANRVFINKLAQFEREFLEPMVNDFLEMSRRMFDGYDVVSVMDNELGIKKFLTITKEDLSIKGTLKARGARYIANKNRLFQDLLQYNNSILSDPAISANISGVKLASMTAELLGEPELFEEGVRIKEQGMIEQIKQHVQEELQQSAHNSVSRADAQVNNAEQSQQMMQGGGQPSDVQAQQGGG